MKTIVIKKNGLILKFKTVKESELKKTWNRMIDTAGGLWNGTDTFTVEVL